MNITILNIKDDFVNTFSLTISHDYHVVITYLKYVSRMFKSSLAYLLSFLLRQEAPGSKRF